MSNSVLKSSNTLPKTPILVIIVFLVLALIALLIWALYNYQMVMNRDLTLAQNPYCLRFGCSTPGTQPVPVELSPSDDPQKTAYQTINWCTVNAPPESLTNALQSCSDGSNSPNLPGGLSKLADFYLNTYMPTCGYNWKSSSVPVNNSDPVNSNPNNPNNPNGYLLNGANDYTLIYLVGCADNIGLTDPNIEKLRSICGPTCS